MTKIRQILRSFTQGKSKVQISEQTGTSRNTVKKYIRKFLSEKMTFDILSSMSDTELEVANYISAFVGRMSSYC